MTSDEVIRGDRRKEADVIFSVKKLCESDYYPPQVCLFIIDT